MNDLLKTIKENIQQAGVTKTAYGELEGQPWHPSMRNVINFIEYEYESIMAIEHWLEDVI